MPQPNTIDELIILWKEKLAELTRDNNEQIAYYIVGALTGNDALWDEWYASGKELNIQNVFNNAADLELPDGINVGDEDERERRWKFVEACVNELEDTYLKPKKA